MFPFFFLLKTITRVVGLASGSKLKTILTFLTQGLSEDVIAVYIASKSVVVEINGPNQ